jgi:hypothetical protein
MSTSIHARSQVLAQYKSNRIYRLWRQAIFTESWPGLIGWQCKGIDRTVPLVEMRHTFFTVGHGNRTLNELLELLQSKDVDFLVE